ncbi:MAG: type I restriction enzyme HsdR N-terminal domain-containing protein [Parvularculaceae bacterium]|nr:type I restriction enzyme HsdR N-terminal domain-containing protein [Parvularculaceae bacterium]
MAKIPKKVIERIQSGIKRFHPVLLSAKSRDVGESDTVTIITDILAEVFGFDKYSEITSEYAIRGTYCDLAIKLDGTLQLLLEVKAVGLELKDNHVKQAVDYAANQGIDWVVLTNGLIWRVYKISFSKPIDQELVLEFDFCALSTRNSKDIESVFLLCKEGWARSVLGEYHTQKQALNRFHIAGLILTDPLLQVIRRELKRISPDVKVDIDDIRNVISTEVLKRDVVQGEEADAAKRKVARSSSKQLRSRKKGSNPAPAETNERTTSVPPPSPSVETEK